VRGRRRARQTRWPRRGLVRFDNVTMRYRPGLEPALRGINLTIEPGWHVGIVGRTGAGKTSLIGTLFRLQEIEEGRIEIDGQDISKMRLIDLRSSLSVIAQEAVLFSGTIRSNLDMAGIYDDSAVSRAFRSCGLRETSAGDLTLDTVVSENGSNFSVGQRQLICLGRALLRDSMVLVLDEATASLDDWTDHKMGETLRTEMGHCTIIVIAHRLHTVMRCDRVCVLDQGRVAEFGAPDDLLNRKAGSLFADLVDETGPATASYLRRLAEAPAAGRQSAISPARSSSVQLHADDGKEKEALLDRTRAALKLLRSSVVELDSPEWTAELQRTNSDAEEWRSTLLRMITSLADLASSRLGVLGERRMNGFGAEALQLDALNPEDERLVDGTVSPTARGVVRPPRNAGSSG
jgi:ABC-type multidrug transport system ATPase subunit